MKNTNIACEMCSNKKYLTGTELNNELVFVVNISQKMNKFLSKQQNKNKQIITI